MRTLHIIVTDIEDEVEKHYLEILSPKESKNKDKEKIMAFLKKVKDLCRDSLI